MKKVLWMLCFCLLAACSDDKMPGEPEPDTPPAVTDPEEPESPEAPAELNAVEGTWVEEDAPDLDEGRTRRLVLCSDFTYSTEIYSALGVLLKQETKGAYAVKDGRITFDNDIVYTYEVGTDGGLTLRQGGIAKRYRRYRYSDDIAEVTSLKFTAEGMVTPEEIAACKGYMVYNAAMAVPVSPQYDNTWVFRALGKNMGACTHLFEITYDLAFLNRVIEYADAALYTRNGQPGGDHRISKSTGRKDDIWPSTKEDEQFIDGAVEQGAVLARIAYCARLILQIPTVWNDRVAAGDRYGYGVTYKQRALKYLAMCDEMYQNWLSRFVRTGDNVLCKYFSANNTFGDPYPWNQALMTCDALNYMAECHDLLGNTATAATYDRIVRANLDCFVADSWTIESYATPKTTCLQWRYSTASDKVRHAEDLNHASLDATVFYNLWLSKRQAEVMDDLIVKFANTMVDNVFCRKDDQGCFPGRISGVWDGQYCDNYVRDNTMELADVRKDWYDKMLEINGSKRINGSLSMTGRALWCKSRRLDAPQDIRAEYLSDGRGVTLSWKPLTTGGTVKVLHSANLWQWSELGSAQASEGTYTNAKQDAASRHYYRLVYVNGNKAGYSRLVCLEAEKK